MLPPEKPVHQAEQEMRTPKETVRAWVEAFNRADSDEALQPTAKASFQSASGTLSATHDGVPAGSGRRSPSAAERPFRWAARSEGARWARPTCC